MQMINKNDLSVRNLAECLEHIDSNWIPNYAYFKATSLFITEETLHGGTPLRIVGCVTNSIA